MNNLKLPEINSRRSISTASTASSFYSKQADHECSICMEQIVEPVKMPGCKHIFCMSCVKNTFNSALTRKCPMCRNPISNQVKLDANLIDMKVQSKILEDDALVFCQKYAQLKADNKLISHQTALNFEIGSYGRLNANENTYKTTVYFRVADAQKQHILGKILNNVEFSVNGENHVVQPNQIDFDSLSPSMGQNECAFTFITENVTKANVYSKCQEVMIKINWLKKYQKIGVQEPFIEKAFTVKFGRHTANKVRFSEVFKKEYIMNYLPIVDKAMTPRNKVNFVLKI